MRFDIRGYRARHDIEPLEAKLKGHFDAAYEAGYESGLKTALIIVDAQLACTARVDPEIPKWLEQTKSRIENMRGRGLSV